MLCALTNGQARRPRATDALTGHLRGFPVKSAFFRGLSVSACALALAACAKKAAPAAAPAQGASAGMSDDQKTLYAMGFIAGQQFGRFKFTNEEYAALQKG